MLESPHGIHLLKYFSARSSTGWNGMMVAKNFVSPQMMALEELKCMQEHKLVSKVSVYHIKNETLFFQ